MTGCPPADQLLGFASGALSDDDTAAIEVHIDACSTCRETLSAIAARDLPAHSFGRYRLETVLGSGGMGVVYRAWDPQLVRPVAIKLLKHAGEDAAGRARLVREAQSLARLSHPNVCQVYDVGTDDDEVWVAMELIEGTTLRRWAGDRSPDELLPVLIGAAEGLAAAHAAGLVHRDIKPENVLVTSDGRPVVTDFGLARVNGPIDPVASTLPSDPHHTATGAVAGTPAYLAPEQLTGGSLDARIDQFAWAVMAWELITGVRPFPIIAGARLDAIRAGVTPPPTLARPLATALARAMSSAPRDRFASMRDLIDALTTTARPTRRSRMPLVIGVAAVLAAAGSAAAWQLANRDEGAPAASARAPGMPPGSVVAPEGPALAPVAMTTIDRAARAEVVDAATADVDDAATVGSGRAPPTVPDRPAVRAGAGRPAVKRALRGSGSPRPAHEPAPSPPVGRLALSPFSRARALATLEAFCHLPIDASAPDPALGAPIMDWGPVVRREEVVATIAGTRAFRLLLYEVRGQRGTYRFNARSSSQTLGTLDVPPGRLVVVCEDDVSEIYELPAAWKGPLSRMRAFAPLAAPPRVAEIAKLDPLHVPERILWRKRGSGKPALDAQRRYLLRATPAAAEGARWDMGRWWLEVPDGVRGADLISAGKEAWFVIERPVLEDQPDGQPPRLVARAAAVLDEMFP